MERESVSQIKLKLDTLGWNIGLLHAYDSILSLVNNCLDIFNSLVFCQAIKNPKILFSSLFQVLDTELSPDSNQLGKNCPPNI